MAVLLEGINIPEGNPITINIYRDGTWINAYTTEDGNAIEVPEPHGDLIDRKALDIYQRAEAAHAEYQEDEDNEYLEGMANGLCEAAKQLSVARTIITASVEG